MNSLPFPWEDEGGGGGGKEEADIDDTEDLSFLLGFFFNVVSGALAFLCSNPSSSVECSLLSPLLSICRGLAALTNP